MSLPRSITVPAAVRRDTVAGLAALRADPPAGSTRATALLVPGFTGSKEDFLPVLEPIAAAGFPVVAVDLPGQYESAREDDAAHPGRFTMAGLGAAVRAAATELTATELTAPVHLLGHSLGGLVCRAALLDEPAARTAATLTLLASGPGAIGGARRDGLERLVAATEGIPLPVIYAAVAETDPKVHAPEVAAFLELRFVTGSAAGLRGAGQALLDEPDLVAELAAYATARALPVLVAHGADDDAWRPAVQAEMAGRLGARHASIPDAVHSPAYEAPEATAKVLIDFWESAG